MKESEDCTAISLVDPSNSMHESKRVTALLDDSGIVVERDVDGADGAVIVPLIRVRLGRLMARAYLKRVSMVPIFGTTGFDQYIILKLKSLDEK